MFNNSNSGYKPRAITGNRSRRPVTRVSGCWEHWVPTASVQPPCWQRSWLASSVPNRCHCQSSNWKRCILLAVGCARHFDSSAHRPLKNRRGHQIERRCPSCLLRNSATSTRWRTLTRREPIHGGSAAPSLAQRVSLALPKSLWSFGTASLRDGVWTKSRPLTAGIPSSRLQGSIHDVSAFVRTPEADI